MADPSAGRGGSQGRRVMLPCAHHPTRRRRMDYRIISADDHIDLQWLPKDLWQKRVPAARGGRAPRVVDTGDGPCWMLGDERWDAWGGRKGVAGAMGGRRMALE